MSVRRFVALGTASQVPTRHRNHNGYMLDWDGEGVLFDPGEGTQRQMIMAGVSASRIHHICITHFHGDHCLGLAGVIQRLSLDKVTRPVHIYYPASGQVYLDRLRNASIFHDVTDLKLVPIRQPGVLYAGKNFRLEAVALDHSVPCYGYRICEPDDVRMLPEKLAAYKIQGRDIGTLKKAGRIQVEGVDVTVDMVSEVKPGQVMAFVMDTRDCEGARQLGHRADMLVIESTYLSSETEEAIAHGHLTAAQAATIALDAKARLLVLTHFSQRYTSIEPFVSEAVKIFANAVAVSDGDVVEMPARLPADAPAI